MLVLLMSGCCYEISTPKPYFPVITIHSQRHYSSIAHTGSKSKVTLKGQGAGVTRKFVCCEITLIALFPVVFIELQHYSVPWHTLEAWKMEALEGRNAGVIRNFVCCEISTPKPYYFQSFLLISRAMQFHKRLWK